MRYVVGLIFSQDLSRVALLRKQKPEWQRGKLNGVGGKVEGDETPRAAMRRECLEESGLEVPLRAWSQFATLAGQNDGDEGQFYCDFFATREDPEALRSMEAEQIEIVQTADIHARRGDMVECLPWLIALAIDHLTDGRPSFVYADYQ